MWPSYIETSPDGYLPMSHYNQHFKASNPTYPLTYAYEYDYPDRDGSVTFPGFVTVDAPYCPAGGPTDCRNGKTPPGDGGVQQCAGVDPKQWGYAYVTEVYGTKYAANEGLPEFKESKAKGKVCYPTDANAIDQDGRDSSDGACDKGQNYVCNGNGSVCLSNKSDDCKCNYADIPGEEVGKWIVDNGSGECGKIR